MAAGFESLGSNPLTSTGTPSAFLGSCSATPCRFRPSGEALTRVCYANSVASPGLGCPFRLLFVGDESPPGYRPMADTLWAGSNPLTSTQGNGSLRVVSSPCRASQPLPVSGVGECASRVGCLGGGSGAAGFESLGSNPLTSTSVSPFGRSPNSSLLRKLGGVARFRFLRVACLVCRDPWFSFAERACRFRPSGEALTRVCYANSVASVSSGFEFCVRPRRRPCRGVREGARGCPGWS